MHRSPVNSPHKSQWRRALTFSFIYTWTYGLENNRDAGDLRHHRPHYDITVMTAMLYGIHHSGPMEFTSGVCGISIMRLSIQTLFIELYKDDFWCQELFRLCGQTPGPINCNITENLWPRENSVWCVERMKLLIHPQTSTVAPLKFGKG